MPIKKIWRSKTFWITGIIPVVTAIGRFAYGEIDLITLFLGAQGIAAIILRFITTEKITL